VVFETENNSEIFDVLSTALRTLGFMSVNIQIQIVGRPGLDPGTLGAIKPRAGLSPNVQIRCSNDVGRPRTYSEVLPSLVFWLNEWLDRSFYTGLANI
jgi:hypothetical protein